MAKSIVAWLGPLMGFLLLLLLVAVVTAQMKERDQREMSAVQLAVPLSKSAVTKGTDGGGEVVLEEHELNLSSTTSNDDVSDWRRTFLVGQDLSVQLHKKLCLHPFFGKTRINGLCKLYIGNCGENSLTFQSCTTIPNSKQAGQGSTRSDDECLRKDDPNCNILHDLMIIQKLFHSNDFQSLTSVGNHTDDEPVTEPTNNVTTSHPLTDKSTNNPHVHTTTQTLDRNYTTTLSNGPSWQSFFSCAKFPNGTLFSYPNSCKQFVECMGRVPYVRQCPSGYMFHPKLMICDKKDHVALQFCFNAEKGKASSSNNYDSLKQSKDKVGRVITKQDETLSRSRRKRREISSSSSSRLCSSSNRKADDYYIQPHSLHCNKFEICSNGKIQVETCGLGALFNPLSLVCDLPHNVDCESRQIDFSTYDCQAEDKYKTSHPDKCDLFIECDNGNLHIKSCPPSTAYHFEDGECVHIYKVKCKKPISLEHDSSSNDIGVNYGPYQRRGQRSTKNLNLACTFNYIAPHPHFCNKFVECEGGRIFIKDCGPGTAYNPRLGQCDWPYNVRQANPNDCSRYRQCHGTHYVEKTCGGTTIFDQEKGKCVFPTGKDYDLACKKDELFTPPPS